MGDNERVGGTRERRKLKLFTAFDYWQMGKRQ